MSFKFLNQACTHNWPWTETGFQKVCVYLYFFVFPHPREQNYISEKSIIIWKMKTVQSLY